MIRLDDIIPESDGLTQKAAKASKTNGKGHGKNRTAADLAEAVPYLMVRKGNLRFAWRLKLRLDRL